MEVKAPEHNVMCLLTDPEGTPLGPTMYLPQNTGPPQLQQIVNQLLKNVNFPLFCLFNPMLLFSKPYLIKMEFSFAVCPGGEVTVCILYIGSRASCATWNIFGEEQRLILVINLFIFSILFDITIEDLVSFCNPF